MSLCFGLEFMNPKLINILTQPAFIVSACALALTIYQAYLSRKHNRISVKPRLTTSTNFYHEGNIMFFKTYLSNRGFGPAIINNYCVCVEDEIITIHDPNELFTIINKHFDGLLVEAHSEFYVFRKGAAIGSQQEDLIAKIALNNSKVSTDMFQTKFKALNLLINFESIYGEKAIYDTREHLQQVRNVDP